MRPEKRRKRRRGRGRPGLGLGAASPWAGPGQLLGASEAGGEKRGVIHPAGFHCPLSLRAPLLPPLLSPCPLVPAYRWR